MLNGYLCDLCAHLQLAQQEGLFYGHWSILYRFMRVRFGYQHLICHALTSRFVTDRLFCFVFVWLFFCCCCFELLVQITLNRELMGRQSVYSGRERDRKERKRCHRDRRLDQEERQREKREAVSKVKRGRRGARSLAKAALIL